MKTAKLFRWLRIARLMAIVMPYVTKHDPPDLPQWFLDQKVAVKNGESES